MKKLRLLESYLDKRSRILRPALNDLVNILGSKGYYTHIIDGGIGRDILKERVNSSSDLYFYRKPLLGQIGIEVQNDFGINECVIFGYLRGGVEILNPRYEIYERIDIERINRSIIKNLATRLLGIS